MSDWSETFKPFGHIICVFVLEKQPKNLHFKSYFTTKRHFGGYFQWNVSPTSRKYVAEQGIMMPSLWQILHSFWSHSSVFFSEKYPENLNFQGFFTTKTSFDGYFQWEACTNCSEKMQLSQIQLCWVFSISFNVFGRTSSFLL